MPTNPNIQHLTPRGANLIKHAASTSSTAGPNLGQDIIDWLNPVPSINEIGRKASEAGPLLNPVPSVNKISHDVSSVANSIGDAVRAGESINKFLGHLWSPLRIVEILMGIALALMGIHTLVR